MMPRIKQDTVKRKEPITENLLTREARSMSLDRFKRIHREANNSDDEDLSLRPTKQARQQDKTSPPALPASSRTDAEPSTSSSTILEGAVSVETEATPDDGGEWITQSKRGRKPRKTNTDLPPMDTRETSMSAVPLPNEAPSPKIIVPQTEGFPSPIDLAEAIEELLPTTNKLPMKFLHSGQVLITPPDMDTYTRIMGIREVQGISISLKSTAVTSQRGIILRYPLLMPLSRIERHPLVASAQRCLSRTGEPTRQVDVTFHGKLPGSLDLERWGTYYTRPYSKEPLRCFRCQRYGHHKMNCTLPVRCGVCSANHDTDECIQKHKNKQETEAKCPNCQGTHHAWNRACTVRRQIVDVQKKVQEKWVVSHRPSNAAVIQTSNKPALAATSTWGSEQPAPADSAPMTHTEFPLLGQAAARPRSPSRPKQGLRLTPPLTPTPAPMQSLLAPAITNDDDKITLTTADLQNLFKTFASTVAAMLGKEIQQDTLEDMSANVVANVRKTQSTKPKTNHPTSTSRKTQQTQETQPQPPPQSKAPGETPASAQIEAEKRALGLQRQPNKLSISCNGTSEAQGAGSTN